MATDTQAPLGSPSVPSRRDAGFTLVELLVVVLIIGVIAGIAVPVFLNQRKKAVDASLRADIRQAVHFNEMLIREPMRQMNTTGWNPVGPRITTADLFRRAGYRGTPGNIVRISGYPAQGWYRICAYNPGASTANSTAAAMYYDSREERIMDTPIDCPRSWGVHTGPSYDFWNGVSHTEYPTWATLADWSPPPFW
jgi:type IV pilus assembly protein PilA